MAVLLGVDKAYHLPLLFCRAFSTAPALWWGIGCILSLFGEIISLSTANEVDGTKWSISWNIQTPWNVDRRFRVTETALSILWVCSGNPRGLIVGNGEVMLTSRQVLRISLSVVLLYGLPDVTLVSCFSHITVTTIINPQHQASKLHPPGDPNQTHSNRLHERIHNILGSLPLRSKYLIPTTASRMDFHSKYINRAIPSYTTQDEYSKGNFSLHIGL